MKIKQLLLIGFGVLTLAACTKKIDQASLETSIKSAFEKKHVKFKSVSCPGGREVKAGDKFECTGELDEAGKVTIAVEQKDGKGSVTYDILGIYVTTEELSTHLSKGGTKVDVKCPKKAFVVRKADKLTCDVMAGADKGKLDLSTDDDEKLKTKMTMEGKPPQEEVEPPQTAEAGEVAE